MKALVVPTIREKSIIEFLKCWNDVKDWDVTIVVEDNPEKTFQSDVDFHYCWKDIEGDLKNLSWIISKRDSAIRSYGFYKAYQLGADYIFTIDDDCLPVDGVKFCEQHICNLESTPKWCESVLGYRTRGLPYKNLGKLENVKFSLGLWQGVPDFDAIHMLADNVSSINIPKTRVMPKNQYFPFCGMNFAFKRDVTPLAYFPLMGEGYTFNRFDDIWFGVICKKICDHLNYHITCGSPCVHHSKASNPFDNLIKEANGIKFNEEFWTIIENIQLQGVDPSTCMNEVGLFLEKQFKENIYIKKLGQAIQNWVSIFTNLK